MAPCMVANCSVFIFVMRKKTNSMRRKAQQHTTTHNNVILRIGGCMLTTRIEGSVAAFTQPELKDQRLQSNNVISRIGGCMQTVRIEGSAAAFTQPELKDQRLHSSWLNAATTLLQHEVRDHRLHSENKTLGIDSQKNLRIGGCIQTTRTQGSAAAFQQQEFKDRRLH